MRSIRVFQSLAVLLLFSLGVTASHAQNDWAIFGQGTGANMRFQSTGKIYGGTIGFYGVKETGRLGIGADFRATMMGGGDTAGAYSDRRMDMGLIGGRASWKSHSLTPYAEALFGYGYFRGGAGTIRQDQTSAALEGLVGLDVKVHGSWDWRVAEVGYDRLKGQFGAVHPISVSTGLVYHLP
jgi:hypothetical protein